VAAAAVVPAVVAPALAGLVLGAGQPAVPAAVGCL